MPTEEHHGHSLRSLLGQRWLFQQSPKMLHSQATPNPSIKRTVKGLRPSSAAYVKR